MSNSYLARHSMRFADLVPPVTTAHWNDRELGQDDGTPDCCCNFFGTLDTQSNVAIAVTDGNKCLEACTLASPGLFLNRHDLQDFILQGSPQEKVDDLMLLKIGIRNKITLSNTQLLQKESQ